MNNDVLNACFDKIMMMILKSNMFNTMYLCLFGLLEQYLF